MTLSYRVLLAPIFAPLFAPLFALAMTLMGCQAWSSFVHDVVPVACAAMGAAETTGCQIHTADGIHESDPRAVAIHEAGHALDMLTGSANQSAIDGAVRAFLGALGELSPGAGAIDGGGL
jgi:hypothetical protein